MADSSFICKTCGGTLVFDPELNKLKCLYCDSTAELFPQDDATQDLKCQTCGAELIASDNTIICYCPYCGNNTIILRTIAKEFTPDYIIPFKLSRNKAERKYREFYRNRMLLPNDFKFMQHSEMQGLYIPYWLFSEKVHVSGNYVAYDVDREGCRKYYNIELDGSMEVNNLPTDASEKMNDDIMDAIEPYDLTELKEFSNNYLPGFMAEYYDVPSEDCVQRFHRRIKKNIESQVIKKIKHKNVSKVDVSYNFEGHFIKYALMPVWTVATNYRDNTYHFFVNGQTGEILGDLPVSWQRLLIFFAACFVIVFFPGLLLMKRFVYAALIALLVATGLSTLSYNTMKFKADEDVDLEYLKAKLGFSKFEEKQIDNETAHKLIK